MANASVGVAMPGTANSPDAFARATTAGSAWGITISRPPARATASTASGSSTVPAPTSIRPSNAAASAAMLSSGRGEFSGTSTIAKSASRSA